MKKITCSEYWTEVENIATECVKEAREDKRDLSDVLFEAIDGHHWMIYTFYSAQILEHSPNDNAYFADFGALEAESASDAIQKMAWAAFRADVSEKAYELQQEAEGAAAPDCVCSEEGTCAACLDAEESEES